MSGVEVAGLVLGCLPLIIQAIESYNEGLDPIKGFFGRDKELPIFIRKLRAQYDHYDQTIQLLFGSITSDVEFALMMTDPGSSQELWKSKEEALQDKLQTTYKSYQRTVFEIEKITKKIASKLDLDRAAEITRNDLEALLAANPKKANDKFEIRKRVRFGMNKKTIKALLEELDECNKSLERFTEKSEKIETYHRATKPSYASRLQRLQQYAKTLHESLSVCWSCSCKSSHRTSLQLELREDVFAPKAQKQIDTPKTSFSVAFSTTDSDGSGVSWLMQTAEICVEEEEEKEHVVPMASPKPRMTKSVSFGTPPPYAVSDPTKKAFGRHQEVKDLCASIQQLHKNAARIGFSLDSKSKLRGAYPLDTAERYTPTVELVSLEDLLRQPPVINGRRSKLSMRDRYSLALTLASNVLYLNSTPWLANEWAARDIMFHRTSNTAQPINIERPYLAPAVVEAANGTARNMQPGGFRNTVLIALAVALLELYFGVTAEKYQESGTDDEVGDLSKQPGPWKLWALARNWTFNESGNLSAAFQNAIRHCITGSSDPCATLEDAECLQAAVENIVLPLQEELHQFLGKTTR
ncbi:hypothetical protein COCCADRAFT_83960 [Bipolaris zeicola 26-R-13]|uniref:DUF7580 domain-containing protein n=1 Tax=Cochliobolus carbonum (strain 26-R-13) TaxID=930089 RepID=W6YKA7_COCC2|nr:uncharacterized protein COCCADRAFT_83960 [Bipolaris zeicola 26-R-13]EUC38075.1 hypothetical protein COCCADRAFT_83960 [Bipolaris zeicola 26-R-13]